jgi:hypothetical protein
MLLHRTNRLLAAAGLECIVSCTLALGGCSFLGDAAVHVEGGNQTSGYLSRPTGLTVSSDDSVQQVAQRTCDGVRPGSYANVVYVGKEPSTSLFDLGDRSRYHYDCEAPDVAAKRAAAPAAIPVAAAAPAPVASAAPVLPAPAAPAAASPAPVGVAASAGTGGAVTGDEVHGRECLRQQGAYEVCVGSCLISSSSPAATVEAECRSSCAARMPVGCKP